MQDKTTPEQALEKALLQACVAPIEAYYQRKFGTATAPDVLEEEARIAAHLFVTAYPAVLARIVAKDLRPFNVNEYIN